VTALQKLHIANNRKEAAANGLDVRYACNGEIRMNESHLQRSSMPEQVIDGKKRVRVDRPIEYLPTA
jgi:hypothetical protein